MNPKMNHTLGRRDDGMVLKKQMYMSHLRNEQTINSDSICYTCHIWETNKRSMHTVCVENTSHLWSRLNLG